MASERVQRRIDQLLDQAEEAAGRRDWQAVAESARMVLDLDQGNADGTSFASMVRQADTPVAATSSFADAAVDDFLASPTPPADSLPSSFASGRYTVSKFLGEGGKKQVYLAHDNTLDRDVAFALIKTEGLDETSRERVKREAQAMGRMGTHPSIMPIYDLGDESGQPFMVQPLMGGGDVEGLIEDAEGPLELARAITIATQTAQGLSFAHSKGIVHRDLKPGNVWLDENGSAKIGDFGLAVATDRSRLTVEKVMVGTVSYMPPEQATGGEVTPRADLYSLGAMLYEMCTGRVPFMGDDDIGIISQHINTPPVAPSWHNSQIPKTLDSLILRLLAKDPLERPESADEVLTALQAVDLSAVPDKDEESHGSLDSMAGGVFVGRQREMDQLKGVFEEVLSGKGRMLTLVGEPGIGKTRTAQELATYASMRGAQVLWGRSYEGGGAPPYWPWVQAIRSHVAATEPERLRRQMGSTASVIAEIVSDVKERLPDLPEPTPIEDPESARFRLFDSIATFLKNASQSQPLVLMLEDIHWADKPSLVLLEFVARELANAKILIVGNYRDMELNRRHPLSVTLGDLTRERLFDRILLRGLQRHDVERFIEIAAGISPPSALVDTVHTQTEGNPLFVTETVRLLIQEGDIAAGQSTKGGTTSWEIRIPEGVREVIGRRLDRLSERCNEVLTIAAVMGRQFRFPVLKMLAEETTEGQLLDAVDDALSARIIEELPEEIGLYQFTHASMQETLTGELSLTRRVTVHARVAEALEKLYADDLASHAETLAYHFEQSQTVHGTEKMVKYSVMAGQAALDTLGYDEAISHFRRAHESRKDEEIDESLAEILFGLGRAELHVLTNSQDQQLALSRLIEAFDFYRSQDDVAHAAEVANAPHQGMLLTSSYVLTEKALNYLDPYSPEAAICLSRRGFQMYVAREDPNECLALIQRGIDIAHNEAMDAAEALGGTRKTLVQLGIGDIYGAITSAEVALTAAERAGEKQIISQAHHFIYLGNAILGNREIAERHHELAVEVARETRDRARLQQVSSMGMGLRVVTGDYEHPELSAEGEVDDWMGLIMYSFKAWAYMEQGKEKEAQSLFEQVLAQASWRIDHGYSSMGPPWIQATFMSLGIRAQVGLNQQTYESLLSNLYSDHVGLNMDVQAIVADAAWAVVKRDVERVPDRYKALLPHSGLVEGWTSTDTLLGLLSVLTEDIDQASTHFEDAIRFCEKAGYLTELAWAQFHYAETLQDADRQPKKVTDLQDSALAIAGELGMKLLTRRVLAKREILKA